MGSTPDVASWGAGTAAQEVPGHQASPPIPRCGSPGPSRSRLGSAACSPTSSCRRSMLRSPGSTCTTTAYG